MDPNENRRPGVGSPRSSGSDYGSTNNGANLILLHPELNPVGPFDQLTARLVIAQYRAGTLAEGVLVALLAGAGLRP